MAQSLLLLCFFTVNVFVVVHSYTELPISNPPAPSPSPLSDPKNLYDEAPSTRKLGKHQYSLVAPPPSEESGSSQEQEIHLARPHHHSVDKSVAGGGVILGGLATAFLVAVFCYIRATGRHKAEPGTPTA